MIRAASSLPPPRSRRCCWRRAAPAATRPSCGRAAPWSLPATSTPGCRSPIQAASWRSSSRPPCGSSLRAPGPCAGVVIFLLAKALKYWAIAALGDRWTFHVLVLRDETAVTTGPYRWLRHPNYVGVAGELIGAALMARQSRDRRYRFRRVRWDDAGAHPGRGTRPQYVNPSPRTANPRTFCER